MALDVHDAPLSGIGYCWPVVSSFGGGLNSTALLVRWVVDGYVPVDKIQFADTGDERPEVYEHIHRFSEWLVRHGMPAIEITRKGGRQETLEQYSLRTGHLPSIAYGRKSCSHKFKIEPQERDVNRWPVARETWKRDEKVIKLIGYGAEEQKRITKAKIEDEKYIYRFPLDEWGMYRTDCADIIRHVGLPVPGKSSCFHCPASTKQEILALPRELQQRAIHIEDNARARGNLKTVKGLGRKFAWRDFLAGAQVDEAPAAVCMYCNDESQS
ncbi:hypothetical protein [Paraburkholderia atlantica]|uniref:hypothetical protein n=1 Tax=Paraburkholderia atlantica TaxID=2654982 RepID=UPI003D1CEC39